MYVYLGASFVVLESESGSWFRNWANLEIHKLKFATITKLYIVAARLTLP